MNQYGGEKQFFFLAELSHARGFKSIRQLRETLSERDIEEDALYYDLKAKYEKDAQERGKERSLAEEAARKMKKHKR